MTISHIQCFDHDTYRCNRATWGNMRSWRFWCCLSSSMRRGSGHEPPLKVARLGLGLGWYPPASADGSKINYLAVNWLKTQLSLMSQSLDMFSFIRLWLDMVVTCFNIFQLLMEIFHATQLSARGPSHAAPCALCACWAPRTRVWAQLWRGEA